MSNPNNPTHPGHELGIVVTTSQVYAVSDSLTSRLNKMGDIAQETITVYCATCDVDTDAEVVVNDENVATIVWPDSTDDDDWYDDGDDLSNWELYTGGSSVSVYAIGTRTSYDPATLRLTFANAEEIASDESYTTGKEVCVWEVTILDGEEPTATVLTIHTSHANGEKASAK